jgi:serine protease Do
VGNETQSGGQAYSDYVAVQDDYGAIQMEVPSSWSDVDGRPEDGPNGSTFASIWAAPNLEDFQNNWGTPGVLFEVTGDKDKVGGHLQMLQLTRSFEWLQNCKLDDRYDYNDGYYRGAFDYYTQCGGPSGSDYMILVAVPVQEGTNVLVFVQIQITTQADLDAADHILATFDIVGNLP